MLYQTRLLPDIFEKTISGELDETEYQSELDKCRQSLWKLLFEPSFSLCAASMSPRLFLSYLEHLRSEKNLMPRNSYIRSLERPLYRLLGRFCTRNDTSGTAGSTFWGVFKKNSHTNLIFCSGQEKFARRVVYPSPAYLDHLIRFVTLELFFPEAQFVPSFYLRKIGNDVLDTRSGTWIKFHDSLEHQVFDACGSGKTAAQVVAEFPDPRTESVIRNLLKKENLVLLYDQELKQYSIEERLAQYFKKSVQRGGNSNLSPLMNTLAELVRIQTEASHATAEHYAALMEKADHIAKESLIFYNFSKMDAVSALLLKLLRDPICQESLRLHRSCRFSIINGALYDHLENRSHEIPVVCGELCQRLDGTRSLQEVFSTISNAVGDASDKDELEDMVEELFKKGVVAPQGVDPVDAGHPWNKTLQEEYVSAFLSLPLSETHKQMLQTLLSNYTSEHGIMDRIQSTHTFLRLAKEIDFEMPAEGKIDRTFFVEDSARNVNGFEVGGELLKDLQSQMSLFLSCCAYLRFISLQYFLPVICNLLPENRSMPLAAFLLKLKKMEKEHVQKAHLRLLGCDKNGSSTDLAQAIKRQIVQSWKVFGDYNQEKKVLAIHHVEFPDNFHHWAIHKRFLSTVDLMIGGSIEDIGQGRYELILNESHATGDELPETTFFQYVQKQEIQAKSEIELHCSEIFGSDVLIFDPFFPSKQAESILLQLDGLCRISHRSDQASFAAKNSIPISQLLVTRSKEGLVLSDVKGKTYRLASRTLVIGDIWPVGADKDMGQLLSQTLGIDHAKKDTKDTEEVVCLPEIRLGKLILQRRTTIVHNSERFQAMSELRDRDLVKAVNKLREEWELSPLVFVRLSDESKPFVCDFYSPLSIETTVNELRKHHGAVHFTDMQPNPDNFWLTFDHQHYTSELRFVVSADGRLYQADKD